MNSNHSLLNTSSTFMSGYLTSLASTNNNPLSVSQSLVFFDKSRHESEKHDMRKEVKIRLFIKLYRFVERKLNLKKQGLFSNRKLSY
jgi:hypothetical protein